VVFASDAVVATVAREEERESYAVALFERSSKGVRVDSFTKRVNHAGEFVSKDSTFREWRAVPIATPYVKI
jgi:hypothetical protein